MSTSITEAIDKARAAGHQAVQLSQAQLDQLYREILSTSGAMARINVPLLPPYSGPFLDIETGEVGETQGRKTHGTLGGVHVLLASEG